MTSAGTPSPMDPVYIVGLDRSGKTTMRAFLASHSRIAIPAIGSNMWTYFYRRFGPLDVAANLSRCLDAMFAYTHVQFLQPDRARIQDEFASGPQTYAHLFSLFLMHFAERENKPRWGAQSGLTEQYADELFTAYPGLKVIHMIRDPRDRYEASLAKWPEGRGRAGGATARWLFSTRLAERNEQRYEGRYVTVRFEDLVRSTEDTIRGVCAFLDEDYEPEMLAMAGADKFRRSLGGEADVKGPTGLLSESFIGMYRRNISDSDLRFMELHAGRRMQRYGYELTSDEWSFVRSVRFGLVDWPDQMARFAAWRVGEMAHHYWPRRLGHKPAKSKVPGARSEPHVSDHLAAPGGATGDRP